MNKITGKWQSATEKRYGGYPSGRLPAKRMNSGTDGRTTPGCVEPLFQIRAAQTKNPAARCRAPGAPCRYDEIYSAFDQMRQAILFVHGTYRVLFMDSAGSSKGLGQ